jgi:hypothetical protein
MIRLKGISISDAIVGSIAVGGDGTLDGCHVCEFWENPQVILVPGCKQHVYPVLVLGDHETPRSSSNS